MGLLDSIERGLERAVNGAFARTFRSGVQPVEISAALKREMDVQAVSVDRDRTLAPNLFTVKMSEQDAKKLERLGAQLLRELEQVVHSHASKQNYQLLAPAVIEIKQSNMPAGTIEVTSLTPGTEVRWSAVLEVEGQRYQLRKGTTVVGRGQESDIRISDNAASRKHLALIWDGKKALASDLDSTNGSKVDGQRFREVLLQPDTVIYIGQTPLRFSFAPLADASAAPENTNPQTSQFWEGV